MSYALTQCNADVIGCYRSAEEAMRAVPGVSKWRQDTDTMDWEGWCADTPPLSPPDYQVTYLGSCDAGSFWREVPLGRAQSLGRTQPAGSVPAQGQDLARGAA